MCKPNNRQPIKHIMKSKKKTLLWVSVGVIIFCIITTIILDNVFNMNIPTEKEEEIFIVSQNI